ncbi:hypothetical protein CASFOL_033919 [Castilleja foliolosa]|uniref:Late embryogenesis abundant protein LEA-2 subgroup domain-containing protein n=1 Tax=Castilleja foliolosa TaxID=1961234 RepID=A0ABD3BYD2_9LAMI
MQANYRMDMINSDEEALFRSYPYAAAAYFVQSPSTHSHANSHTDNITFYDHLTTNYQSPDNNSEPATNSGPAQSSSNGSFAKKTKYSQDLDGEKYCHVKINDVVDEDEEDDDEENEKRSGWAQYLSFGYSDSGWWVLVQLSWRFLLSLTIALTVFYVAVKPPAPKVSIKIAGIREFRLGEGVDRSGVTTKLLSCNCSMNLIIDNNSKLFALHIHPPHMELLFGHLPFAVSQMQDKEVYAGSDDITMFRLTIGTRNKAMYGAGRNMQDLLESGEGLPLVLRVSFRSTFHVIFGLFESKFHHEAQCLVVLSDQYDKKHRTQVYNSTCIIYS